VYLNFTEVTGSQPHVTEGQSDREGVTKLNHGVTDSLRMRLPQRLWRRRRNEDRATKIARPRWRDEDSADKDGVMKTTWRRPLQRGYDIA